MPKTLIRSEHIKDRQAKKKRTPRRAYKFSFYPITANFFHCAIFDSLFHFDELCANEKMGYDELGVLGHR